MLTRTHSPTYLGRWSSIIDVMNIRSQVSRDRQYSRLLRHPHIIKLSVIPIVVERGILEQCKLDRYEVILTTTDIVLVFSV